MYISLIDRLINLAIDEDIGKGDLSTDSIKSYLGKGTFEFLAKEEFILCGIDVVRRVFELIDSDLDVHFFRKDGDMVPKSDVIGSVKGDVASILKGERIALNFLQRMSGIATNTYNFVEKLKYSNIKILDTRKTLPGHRILEKYSVKTGGGYNHRFGLFDGVMLKDNHIDAVGGIRKAVEIVRRNIPITVKIEVETRNLIEVKEAVEAGVDIIMLDNFDIEMISAAADIIGGKSKIEVSGGVTINNIDKYKDLPIDYISVGALTHQARSVDISLKYRGEI
ncbi:carboxylating nicotinate-nucleotide diphosphorylase [Calditerrivibrio sp.]|jgi:nicotinate-nucleotide pyrophosphorylase (carboxylating)|uniref:carboxylating nicotinate-nucleotide diphosphorylase n=1 Tax=Calditerrivibrio sp. TaxID=2792612 RepID=UPI003D0D9372